MSNITEELVDVPDTLSSFWSFTGVFERSVWVLVAAVSPSSTKMFFLYILISFVGDYGVLLGDSAYGLRRYLLTPFTAPENDAEQRYNDAHTCTRTRIEHTFGITKNRSGCILIPLRVMGPDMSCAVILACFVLHNIGVMNRDLWQPLPVGIDNQGSDPPGDNTHQGGKNRRMEYVRNYFQ